MARPPSLRTLNVFAQNALVALFRNHSISRSIDFSSLYSSSECCRVIQISMECLWKL